MKLLLPFLLAVFAVATLTADRATPRPGVRGLLVACLVVSGGLTMRRFI